MGPRDAMCALNYPCSKLQFSNSKCHVIDKIALPINDVLCQHLDCLVFKESFAVFVGLLFYRLLW